MRTRLLSEDFSAFEAVWNSTTIDQPNGTAVQDLGYIRLDVPGIAPLEFNYHADRLFFLGDLFEVVRYSPVQEAENLRLAEAIFGHLRETAADCFKIWEVMDARKILGRYT